jgi:hypothetical protein
MQDARSSTRRRVEPSPPLGDEVLQPSRPLLTPVAAAIAGSVGTLDVALPEQAQDRQHESEDEEHRQGDEGPGESEPYESGDPELEREGSRQLQLDQRRQGGAGPEGPTQASQDAYAPSPTRGERFQTLQFTHDAAGGPLPFLEPIVKQVRVSRADIRSPSP